MDTMSLGWVTGEHTTDVRAWGRAEEAEPGLPSHAQVIETPAK